MNLKATHITGKYMYLYISTWTDKRKEAFLEMSRKIVCLLNFTRRLQLKFYITRDM
jgi:hypothetical protein